MVFPKDFIEPLKFEFERYKVMGDKTFEQLRDEDLYWRPAPDENSIAILIKHLAGNMKSRWTDIFSSDGEKPWRQRDGEFEEPPTQRAELLKLWETGWQILFDTLEEIGDENFDSVIFIRTKPHTLPQACLRQLAHYASHVGQIVLLGKMIRGKDWNTLSIPKGGSEKFNRDMMNNHS